MVLVRGILEHYLKPLNAIKFAAESYAPKSGVSLFLLLTEKVALKSFVPAIELIVFVMDQKYFVLQFAG